MENNNMVNVINMSNGSVTVSLPDLRFSRTWPQKGAKLAVPKDILREGIFDQGLENMIKSGTLFIDDLEFKKEIGLEPEDAQEAVNVIFVDDKYMERMLVLTPNDKFKKEFEKLTLEQKKELAKYAISKNLINLEKDDIIKKATGIDIFKGIELNKLNNEPIPDENK